MTTEPHQVDEPERPSADSPQASVDSSLLAEQQIPTILFKSADAAVTSGEMSPGKVLDLEKAAELAAMPVSLGRYELKRVLGSGAFGAVYLGFDSSLNRQVAIKVPKVGQSSRAKSQFLAEARQLAQLRHPGIVAVFDVGVDAGQCYIVSDYLHGTTLDQWLESNRPGWPLVAKISADIAEALAHAHTARTIHRDLKPGNVIIVDGLRPVIVDFGLAVSDDIAGEMSGGLEAAAESAERGVIVGTPAYMSPEQTRGEGHRIDGRTDIYSLGVMLYMMLTGRLPFPARQMRELFLQIQNDEPQPPRQLVPTLPRELEQIVLKAMSKSLSERYTTAMDMAEDLRAVVQQAGGAGPLPQNPGMGFTPAIAPAISPSPPSPGPIVSMQAAVERTIVAPKKGSSDFALKGLMTKSPPPGQPPLAANVNQKATGSSPIRRVREAERRRITVLDCACDVFASAEMQETLGQEEQRDLLVQFQDLCRAVMEMFEGIVVQTTDDGVMACFGYPVAIEDATLRAVRAGLKLLEVMSGLNQTIGQTHHVSLSASIGAHSDLAVVEDKGEGEPLSIVGQVRNIASQIGDLAEIGNVVISEDTYRLARGYFDCESLGQQRFKGIGEKEIYRVRAERRVSSRLEAAGTSGLTPLVGRDQEVGLLEDRWEKATEGIGQVVLLIGDPGLGKSRLVEVLKDVVSAPWLAGGVSPPVSGTTSGTTAQSTGGLTPPASQLSESSLTRRPLSGSSVLGKLGGAAAIIEWRAAQHHQHSSLRPVISGFERLLGYARIDSADKKLDKLIAHLKPLNLDGDEELALLSSLLSIPPNGRFRPLTLTPEKQKEKTLDLLLDWLRAQAVRQPMLFIVEDLHWLDPTTLEFVQMVVEETASDPLLTLLTSRPEFVVPWTNLAHQTQIALNRLSRRQMEEMMSVRAGKPIPQRLVELIIDRTDGVPLFVEEFTTMIVESESFQKIADDGSSVTTSAMLHEIPATLQDLLMARLHRLDSNLDVVQMAATIGREFSYELLLFVSRLETSKLQSELGKLVKAEILLQRGRGSRMTYSFKHALLQDAAYQSMLKRKRQQFHQSIGEVIERNFPDLCADTPEVLAQHFTEAGLAERAIEFWDLASVRSLKRSAHREAIEQLTRGIDLIRTLPESRDLIQQQVDLHVRLGVSLQSTKGYSAPEVETNYLRAHELCDQLGDSEKAFPVLYGLFRYFMLRANYAKSRELAGQLIELAEASQNASFLVAAHRAMAAPMVYQGEHEAALRHFARVLQIEVTPELRNSYHYEVVDPWIVSRSYMSWALWLLGFPDKARQHTDWAVAEAERLEHPFSIALALSFAQWFHQFCGDVAGTRDVAERSLDLSREQHFAFWIGWCQVLHGWCIAQQNDAAAGIAEIREGYKNWQAVGSRLGNHYFLALLAEACLTGDLIEPGLQAVAEAQAFADETGEGYWLSELPRLRGELLLRRDGLQNAATVAEAEACFQSALDIARQQHAKSLELRAAMSLARVWQQFGRKSEARELLAPVYDWFAEGFDTQDLIEAKALLATRT